MDDYWVCGGSCIKADDGQYHLFASRWPKRYPFLEGYVFHSEVVHAVSPQPEGPYEFREVVLPARGEGFWDGKMPHNPTITRWGDTYYLYYIGSTYEGESPSPDSMARLKRLWLQPAYKNIRIGLATAQSLSGPWERHDAPILAPQPHGFDSVVVTNPAPCVTESGETFLVYRTHIRGSGNRLALARAPHPDSAYERVIQRPIAAAEVEDPFIWQQAGRFYVLAKDMTGEITGEKHAGVFLSTTDLTDWQLNDPPKAYSRLRYWDDGDSTMLGSFERPQLLIQDGRPTHLFAATADGPGGFRNAANTWNQVVPLRLK
jgi:hypothetical protein